MIEQVKSYLMALQDRISQTMEQQESHAKFHQDAWSHAGGGGGRTRVLAAGDVFEQAGVNFSHVFGDKLPAAATAQRPELIDRRFQATGVSLVFHPLNPYVPTTHFNIRFLIAENDHDQPIWWFGGGYDLTPYYGFDEDCQHWHQTAKQACDPFDKALYPKFKQWCDQYFYLRHRQETRGIGGLFFDDFNPWDFERCFAFWQSVGDSFIDAYLPILQRRRDMPYGERERNFQCYRRGRYVEFNLVYDRGTLFGLQSNGRIESILMSLPPVVNWRYNWKPEAGSEEDKLYQRYLVPQQWV